MAKPRIRCKGKWQGVQTKIGYPWQNAWFHFVPTNLSSSLFLEQKLSRLCLELPLLPVFSTESLAQHPGKCCVCRAIQTHLPVFVLGSSPVFGWVWGRLWSPLVEPKEVWFQLSLQPQSAYSRADTSRNPVLKVEQTFLIVFMFSVSLENAGLWNPPLNMLSLTSFYPWLFVRFTTTFTVSLLSALDAPNLFCTVRGRTMFMWTCDFSMTQVVWTQVWKKPMMQVTFQRTVSAQKVTSDTHNKQNRK